MFKLIVHWIEVWQFRCEDFVQFMSKRMQTAGYFSKAMHFRPTKCWSSRQMYKTSKQAVFMRCLIGSSYAKISSVNKQLENQLVFHFNIWSVSVCQFWDFVWGFRANICEVYIYVCSLLKQSFYFDKLATTFYVRQNRSIEIHNHGIIVSTAST